MSYKLNSILIEKTRENVAKKQSEGAVGKQKLTIDNIILCALARTHNTCFTGDKESIHRVFLKLKGRFPNLFKGLNFMTCENFPFSKQLEQIYFRFQQTQAISVPNPLYKRFEMNNKTKEIIGKEIKPEECKEYEKELNEIAQVLDNELSI